MQPVWQKHKQTQNPVGSVRTVQESPCNGCLFFPRLHLSERVMLESQSFLPLLIILATH